METKKIIVFIVVIVLGVLTFFLVRFNNKKSLKIQNINKESKRKQEEENEKFKKDNPEEYQKMIIKRKEKLLLKKKKRKISIVVGIIGVLVIGVTKGPPIGYLGIAVVMYLIEKS